MALISGQLSKMIKSLLEWQKQWQWCWELNTNCTFLVPAHRG